MGSRVVFFSSSSSLIYSLYHLDVARIFVYRTGPQNSGVGEEGIFKIVYEMCMVFSEGWNLD